jgi:hypothetical protein
LRCSPDNPYNHGGERGVYESTEAARLGIRHWAGANDTTGSRKTWRSIRLTQTASLSQCGITCASLTCEPMACVGSGVIGRSTAELTWQRLTMGFRASTAIGRIGIALAASNPQRLYAIVIQTSGLFQGFYRSDDGGDSWLRLPYRWQSFRCAVDLWLVVWPGLGSILSIKAHVFGAGSLLM